jgi:hypothetical protein
LTVCTGMPTGLPVGDEKRMGTIAALLAVDHIAKHYLCATASDSPEPRGPCGRLRIVHPRGGAVARAGRRERLGQDDDGSPHAAAGTTHQRRDPARWRERGAHEGCCAASVQAIRAGRLPGRLYPHQFSGVQRQSIAIARALAQPQAADPGRSGPGAKRVDPCAGPESAAGPAGIGEPELSA